MNEFAGILKRDNAGLYLQSSGTIYRLVLQRMPIDAMEKNVIITGELETGEIESADIIIAEGVRLDDSYQQSEF